MPNTDDRVDAYIAKSADFAQPILNHIRSLVHQACPEAEEKIKWGFPHFDHKGMMCSMASFKAHCAFTFWKGSIMADPHKVLDPVGETAMGHLGKITSVDDLPSDEIMIEYIREAKRLNDENVKLPTKKPSDKKELDIPEYFLAAVKKNKKAWETFQNFSYSNQKDYVEWVTEAKTEATREKRLSTTVEWLSEGKIRNWKYQK